MAASLTPNEQKNMDRRKRITLQPDPEFLRLPHQGPAPSRGIMSSMPVISAMPTSGPDGTPLSQQQIERIDEQAAYALHQQLNVSPTGVPLVRGQIGVPGQNIRGRLLISVMQVINMICNNDDSSYVDL